MEETAGTAVAVVGAGGVLPDAPGVRAFWENVKTQRCSTSDVQPGRRTPARCFVSNHSTPDKTYSKPGVRVREFAGQPARWRLTSPARVVDAMDVARRWALAAARQAILGNATAGERHHQTALRIA